MPASQPSHNSSLLKRLFVDHALITGAALVALVALVLYTITLAPDMLSHDVGDWQSAAITLGIGHPPGSPLYLLLGHIFSWVPLGTVAARVNFLSVVMGAAGVAALFAFMYLWLGRWLPALVAAASLGLAGEWWSHSSVATPYNAVPAFMAVFLILMLLWQKRGDVRLIYLGSLLFAVGLGYHITLMYYLPVLLAGIVVFGPWRRLLSIKSIALTLACFVVGLSFYLYLPLRSAAEPPIQYSRIDSLASFFKYVSASESRSAGHGNIALPVAGEVKDRFVEVIRQGYYPSYAFLVFGPAIILLYPAVWPALKRHRRMLIFLAITAPLHMAVVFTISGIYAQYYLPLLLYFSIWAGFSVYLIMLMAGAYISSERWRLLPVALIGALYFGVLLLGITRTWDFVNHREDLSMRQYADLVFAEAEQRAVVLANWESYTGLLFAQKIDGQRPDLQLVRVTTDETWRDFLAEARKQQPPQVLLSRSLPFTPAPDLVARGNIYFLSIKGRTYQDYSHGEPGPAAVQLFEVK